jgi:hypothetical protein
MISRVSDPNLKLSFISIVGGTFGSKSIFCDARVIGSHDHDKVSMSTRDPEVIARRTLASTSSHPPIPQYPTPCVPKTWRIVRRKVMVDF